MTRSEGPRVLQFCHGYDGPFLDCARQYAQLFAGTPYQVTTVYLTGEPSIEAEQGSASDEVIFLGYDSQEVRGLKLAAIRALKRILHGRDFRLCIAHRFKPAYVALLASDLPVIAVHHAFDDYRRLSRRLFAACFRRRLSLLGVSDAVRDDMRACLPSWPAGRIETLYNRIDVEALKATQVDRQAARQALGLPADAWIVGNVGRLHPDKDQATLLRGFAEALPQLPAGSLLAILGSGRLEAELKALAGSLGIAGQVRFLGQVPEARRYQPVRVVANYPSWDRFVFLVHPRTGITSLAQIKEKRYPLRLSTREDRTHSSRALIAQTFAAYGFTLADLESWGGSLQLKKGPGDERRIAALREGTIDAVFDEGLVTWFDEALAADMRPITPEEPVIRRLEALGWRKVVIPAGRFRNLKSDHLCIDFSGWPLYTRASLPDEDAYKVCDAIAAREGQIAWEDKKGWSPFLGVGQLGRETDATPMDVPLHSGAARWYREHGFEVKT